MGNALTVSTQLHKLHVAKVHASMALTPSLKRLVVMVNASITSTQSLKTLVERNNALNSLILHLKPLASVITIVTEIT